MTDPRRRFSGSEHTALYLAADGRCQRCGRELGRNWQADHVDPHSRGGRTDVINGQALCPECNQRKAAKVEPSPRQWQKRFIAKYHANTDPDFLLVACPGAGKTIGAGYVARDLLRDGIVDRLLIVVPTAALRPQWMLALAALGIAVDGLTMNNGQGEMETIDGQRTRGWVVTYASLFSDRGTHRILNARRPTIAILDEIHHLSDEASWGKAALEALGPCVRRLGLSGTPFPSTGSPIPFVEFDEDGIARYKDSSDGTPYPRGFDYSYGRALQDAPSPVRPILFDQYSGDITWLERWTDEERTENIADPKLSQKDRTKVKRHALDVRGDWLRQVLADADGRLTMVREDGDPKAQGLVLCIDTAHAHRVRALLAQLVGLGNVVVAVSKDEHGRDATPQARDTIDTFASGGARWLVAVAMVSEGIDIPTLRVGVWATVVRSPLRFRQGMGRLVRRTGLPEEVDQTAYLFVPKDPAMVKLADQVYEEVRLALTDRQDDDEFDEAGTGQESLWDQDELPFDAFRAARADGAATHAPGMGSVDPEYAASVARESGTAYGEVVKVLLALAKMGATSAAGPTHTPGTDEAERFAVRLKRAKGQLESLLKQVTSAWMKSRDIPYSSAAFGRAISRIKADIYRLAEIEDYDRADLPQIDAAIAITKKRWAEL